MMDQALLVITGVQGILLAGGVGLLFRRRERVDRIMVTQLLATLCVGLMLTLGEVLKQRALADVALVLTLLAVITTVAFVRLEEGSVRGAEE